eukprot:gene27005-8773_t
MTLGSYAFMMLLSAIVNLLSLHKKQPWLYWATVAVALGVVLDMNICVADWLVDAGADMRKSDKSWNWELRWEGGQWMTFIIACKGCETGVWFAFTGMWMVVLAHIFLKRGKLTPDFSKVNPVAGLRPLFALFGTLMCLAGMVMVAVENHKKNDANKARFGMDVGTYKDNGAQETYDVFQTFVGALFIYWGYLASNNRVGVAGLCMHFGVVNRLLGATGKADRSNAQIAGIFVLTWGARIWNVFLKWYGQMGFTALLGAAFHTYDYKQGLDAVFFWACLQLATQTPFTTCEGKGSFLAFV